MFRETVASLGPLLLFLLVLLQQAGAPYPITPVLIVAGALSVHGHLPAAAVIGLAIAAAVIADLGGSAAGLRYCACPNEASAARIARELLRMGCLRVRGGIFAWKDAGLGVDAAPDPGMAVASRPVT